MNYAKYHTIQNLGKLTTLIGANLAVSAKQGGG